MSNRRAGGVRIKSRQKDSFGTNNDTVIIHRNDIDTTDFTKPFGRSPATHKASRATKKVITNGEITLHQRYIYRGYLQIACCDLQRSWQPALWYILWDPTQPTATRPLAIQKDGTWYTYGWDLTKNICELYDPNGYIRTTYTYSPYGAVSAEGDVTQPLQWSSEFADNEISVFYYNYRFFNPKEGRWMSRDIIKSLNLYSYTSSPLIQIDIVGAYTSSTSDNQCSNDQTDNTLDSRSEKNVGGLIPVMQTIAREHIQSVNKALAELDKCKDTYRYVVIIQGYRSIAEQNELYNKGKGKVTNAKGGTSYHNYGVAYDIGVFRKKRNHSGPATYLGDDDGYKLAGEIGTQMGLRWGGEFQKINR